MNKYGRKVYGFDGSFTVADVYAVIEAWDVRCPARQHALKKILCAGQRGVKTAEEDLIEAIQALDRAIALQQQRYANDRIVAPPRP
jgi:hypothetical protein